MIPRRCAMASMVSSRPDIRASRVACASRSRATICPSAFSATPPPTTNRIPFPARRNLASMRNSIVPGWRDSGRLQVSPSRMVASSLGLSSATTLSSSTVMVSTTVRTSSRSLIGGRFAQPTTSWLAFAMADRTAEASGSKRDSASPISRSDARNARSRSRTRTSISPAGMRQPLAWSDRVPEMSCVET